MEEILAVIKKINWSNFQSASILENVDNNLQNLVSNNTELAEEAYWNFDNKIVLQGDLYESGFYIIPFLMKTLTVTNNNERVLDLLFELSNGSSYKDEYVKFEILANPFLYYIPSSKTNQNIKVLEKACKFAIYEQKDLLVNCAITTDNMTSYQTILDIFLNLKLYGDINDNIKYIKNHNKNNDKAAILNDYKEEF